MRPSPFFISCAVVFLITTMMALAATPAVPSLEDLSPQDLSPLIQQASAEMQGQELPAPFRSLFGNERVNVHVEDENGEAMVVGLVTEDGKIKNIVTAEVKNPSLNIYTTKATIAKILIADNPMPALREALKAEEMRYEGVGFKNKVKYFFASLLARVAGAFIEEPSSEQRVVKQQAGLSQNGTSRNEVQGDESDEEQETNNFKQDADSDVGDEDSTLTDTNEEDADNADGDSSSGDSPLELSGTKHIVKLIEGGMSEKELTINVGDTIVWKNERTGRIKKGLIFGNQKCRVVKSTTILPGEEFSWTFNEPMFCLISDGIYTTQSLKLTVR